MDDKIFPPIHPGEILTVDFIEGCENTQTKLAVSIGVPPRRINQIVHGKRRIAADTAIRSARWLGNTEEFWMNLQSKFELRLQRRALCVQISAIEPLQVVWPLRTGVRSGLASRVLGELTLGEERAVIGSAGPKSRRPRM